MENSLMGQGVELMIYGMGTVVVFLTVLVFVTGGMSALVQRYFPAPPPAQDTVPAPAGDATLMAVITAAIHRHRTSRTNRNPDQ